MGRGKFYMGGGIKEGGNFFRGEGNSQKYCIIVGGDEGSREAVWGYSSKCVIVSGCVAGLRGLVFRLFCSARTGLRKDLICLSCLPLSMQLTIGAMTFCAIAFLLAGIFRGYM